MKNKRVVILLGSICLVLVLAALPFMAACAQPAPAPAPSPAPAPAPSPAPPPAPAEPIELSGVTFLPAAVPAAAAFHVVLRDRVKELSNGELIIEYKGGPEVIPGGEQAMAAKRGVVDIAWVPAGRYLGLVPALEAMELSRLSHAGERESGFYDTMLELHKEAGLYFLGRGLPLEAETFLQYIFTNKKVDTPYDLAGQKLGRGVLFLNFLKKAGIVSVSLARGEEYTALETGVVDGVISGGAAALTGFSGQEVVKYVIDHPFGTYNVMTLINLDTWNSLPKHLQDALIKAQLELERDWPAQQAKLEAGSWQKMLDAGVEIIKFSPADAKWFLDTAYGAEWDALVKKYPDVGPSLRELAVK